MKKAIITLLAIAMSVLANAASSYIAFSTSGTEPDRYADGTPVLDGEVYACVWIKDGSSFSGLMADGTLIDSVNNRLIGMSPLAENGHCKPVFFMLDGENAELNGGTFEIYLLDTRHSPKQDQMLVPAGVSQSDGLQSVNSWTMAAEVAPATNKNLTSGDVSALNSSPVSGEGVASALPDMLPNPVIKSIKVECNNVILTVGNTVPYLRYGIASGATPAKLDKNYNVPGANGNTNGELTLVISDPDNHRFFKVVRD